MKRIFQMYCSVLRVIELRVYAPCAPTMSTKPSVTAMTATKLNTKRKKFLLKMRIDALSIADASASDAHYQLTFTLGSSCINSRNTSSETPWLMRIFALSRVASSDSVAGSMLALLSPVAITTSVKRSSSPGGM